MKKDFVIQSCYALFRSITPLSVDCGKLCEGKCCKGSEKTGMLIFPGEEHFIDKDINIVESDNGASVAVCNGKCNRHYRPLSCRIYPLFPVVKNENGREYIDVVFDPRADCPLCCDEVKISPRFIRAVERVGKYLLLNEQTAQSYRRLSAEIEEIKDLKELLCLQ